MQKARAQKQKTWGGVTPGSQADIGTFDCGAAGLRLRSRFHQNFFQLGGCGFFIDLFDSR